MVWDWFHLDWYEFIESPRDQKSRLVMYGRIDCMCVQFLSLSSLFWFGGSSSPLPLVAAENFTSLQSISAFLGSQHHTMEETSWYYHFWPDQYLLCARRVPQTIEVEHKSISFWDPSKLGRRSFPYFSYPRRASDVELFDVRYILASASWLLSPARWIFMVQERDVCAKRICLPCFVNHLGSQLLILMVISSPGYDLID